MDLLETARLKHLVKQNVLLSEEQNMKYLVKHGLERKTTFQNVDCALGKYLVNENCFAKHRCTAQKSCLTREKASLAHSQLPPISVPTKGSILCAVPLSPPSQIDKSSNFKNAFPVLIKTDMNHSPHQKHIQEKKNWNGLTLEKVSLNEDSYINSSKPFKVSTSSQKNVLFKTSDGHSNISSTSCHIVNLKENEESNKSYIKEIVKELLSEAGLMSAKQHIKVQTEGHYLQDMLQSCSTLNVDELNKENILYQQNIKTVGIQTDFVQELYLSDTQTETSVKSQMTAKDTMSDNLIFADSYKQEEEKIDTNTGNVKCVLPESEVPLVSDFQSNSSSLPMHIAISEAQVRNMLEEKASSLENRIESLKYSIQGVNEAQHSVTDLMHLIYDSFSKQQTAKISGPNPPTSSSVITRDVAMQCNPTMTCKSTITMHFQLQNASTQHETAQGLLQHSATQTEEQSINQVDAATQWHTFCVDSCVQTGELTSTPQMDCVTCEASSQTDIPILMFTGNQVSNSSGEDIDSSNNSDEKNSSTLSEGEVPPHILRSLLRFGQFTRNVQL